MKVETGSVALALSAAAVARPEKQVLTAETKVQTSSDTVSISADALAKLKAEQADKDSPLNGGGWEPPIKPLNGGGWEPPIKPQDK